tara:strand:+ start:216 stop:317 length:102 start_codon:yes stop_codon:yes gene_type:complete
MNYKIELSEFENLIDSSKAIDEKFIEIEKEIEF